MAPTVLQFGARQLGLTIRIADLRMGSRRAGDEQDDALPDCRVDRSPESIARARLYVGLAPSAFSDLSDGNGRPPDCTLEL